MIVSLKLAELEAENERLRESVIAEIEAKNPDRVDALGLCPGCQHWGTNRFEGGDDHADGCVVAIEVARWRNWKVRVRAALSAAKPAEPLYCGCREFVQGAHGDYCCLCGYPKKPAETKEEVSNG